MERFEFKLALKFDHLGFELGLRFLQLLSSCYARCRRGEFKFEGLAHQKEGLEFRCKLEFGFGRQGLFTLIK